MRRSDARSLGLGALIATIAASSGAPLTDLEGRRFDAFRSPPASAHAFIFVRTDCPIANSYAPELRRLAGTFASREVAFWIVYLDPKQSSREIREHMEVFQLPGTPLRDAQHAFAGRCGARITPEAAVFSKDAALTYCGRIDDRFVTPGRQKRAPQTRDLADAISATLAGERPRPAAGQAVGCMIGDLR